TISGVITDATGATVPGAKVMVTETQTGTRIPAVSDNSGQYTAPFLLPGQYDISVQSPGFKAALRKGLNIGSGDHSVIDFKLDVGDVSASVEVTADAPLLDTQDASLGQAVTTKEVEELPITGCPPMMASAPPQDAVQEVHVKVSDTDAAFGHSAGGTLDHITKTGTNSRRGSAWEFNQPNTLTANDFFLNKAGSPRPVTHLNQYGVTAGGPIYLPKPIDTRNKLFWFFAWESMKDGQPNAFIGTVPTDAMRAGNFSGLTTLYDPFSATLSGSTVNRTALPGN